MKLARGVIVRLCKVVTLLFLPSQAEEWLLDLFIFNKYLQHIL